MAEREFVVLEQRAVLAVAGPDRRGFLQGLISNDVEKVAPPAGTPGRAIHAALLTAQGKYLHDFFLAEQGEVIHLDAEAPRLADLQRRLAIYRLRAKVTLAPAPELTIVAAFGTGTLAALGLAEQAGSAAAFAGGIAFVDPRLAALGARIIAPRAAASAALRHAGFVEAEFARYDRLRLACGVPDGSRDLAIEKSILLEAGFDELNGVDWQKGCYVGQELTARTKYRGLVKRRLLPVTVEGGLPPPGTPITANGQEAGELRSGRDELAIALLRLEALDAAALEAGQAQLRPRKPDWLRLGASEQSG